jgi:hypothetical protein
MLEVKKIINKHVYIKCQRTIKRIRNKSAARGAYNTILSLITKGKNILFCFRIYDSPLLLAL